tara:strand:- start:4653 stop:5090 length:438 start_codon:yes stop_codon:yes gene_type:complete
MKLISKNNVDTKLILSKHGISRTKFRSDLLSLFYIERSLTVEGILHYFKNTIDKVTVYRSLESFEIRGLIHKVPDSKNLKRYSLCVEQECSIDSHNHNHGHFICHTCNQTFCMQDVNLPRIKSKGFYIQELKLIAEGYCQDCYTK